MADDRRKLRLIWHVGDFSFQRLDDGSVGITYHLASGNWDMHDTTAEVILEPEDWERLVEGLR